MIENPEKSKSELFSEDPDRFIDARDLMIAIMRTPDGPAIHCEPKDSIEARHAIVACSMELSKKIIVMEAKASMNKNRIVKPQGGFLHGVRDVFGKKKGN